MQQILSGISERLLALVQSESAALGLDMGRLSADDMDVMIRRVEIIERCVLVPEIRSAGKRVPDSGADSSGEPSSVIWRGQCF